MRGAHRTTKHWEICTIRPGCRHLRAKTLMTKSPGWTQAVMAAAALYHLGCAVVCLGWPLPLLRLAGLPDPNLPDLFRAMGALIGILGFGYGMAAFSPIRYWPIVLMGAASKVLAAAAIGWRVWGGVYPSKMLWIVALDDLVWLAAFGAILCVAHDRLLNVKRTLAPEVVRIALHARTQHGVSLDELSRLSPVLLVFLRHEGCTFCREALADLAVKRKEIERAGARLVLVHMSTQDCSGRFFARYGLNDAPRVSDPQRALYRAFGLRRGRLADVFGPKVWWRGFQAAILRRHGVGRLTGDGFQMPGVFLLFHGEVVRSYSHQSSADRPDYVAVVTGRHFERPEFST